ncbi:MAG TPA: flagellar basal body rod protein FlgC [Sedimentisphaerales bacterium]|nr:flagellar basal body rod protein FlgC [Sedimentisphaerales bacterium]
MEINNSYSPIDIAMSGLRAQDKNMKVISSNIANMRTTDNGKGEPYRRIEAKMRAANEGISCVEVDELAEDMSSFKEILDPGHPDAGPNGYVQMPNVNLPMELINMNTAKKLYQANAAVMKRYQQMSETTLELLR